MRVLNANYKKADPISTSAEYVLSSVSLYQKIQESSLPWHVLRTGRVWGAAPLYTLSLEEPTPLYKTGEVDFFCFVAFDAGVTTPARGGVSADPWNMPRPSFKQGRGVWRKRRFSRPTYPPTYFQKNHTPTHSLKPSNYILPLAPVGRHSRGGAWPKTPWAICLLFYLPK